MTKRQVVFWFFGWETVTVSISNCHNGPCKSNGSYCSNKRWNPKKKLKPRKGLINGIGNTSLIRINSLSDATGCEILQLLVCFTRGVMYTKEEAEGRRLNNPFDTRTEGIGINRLTQNFMMTKLDGAVRGTAKEAVEMTRVLVKNDGLFPVSFSAMNCIGAVRVAQSLGPRHTIVTILCDSGLRHLSKFYDAQYLSQHGLTPTATGLEVLGVK